MSIRVNQKKINSSWKEYVALNFDQWLKFSENSKPVRVSLWLTSFTAQLFAIKGKQKKRKSCGTIFKKKCSEDEVGLWFVYQITENTCFLRYFTELIQNQKRYPPSLDGISILTWRLHVISNQNFSCELSSSRTFSLRNISNLSLRL